MVNYKKVQAYLDMAVGLMEENNKNAAILNCAFKVLSKQAMTKNVQQYFGKTMCLCLFFLRFAIQIFFKNIENL